MGEAIVLVIIGQLVAVIGAAVVFTADMAPGGTGKVLGVIIFLIGVWVFVVGIVILFTGWVAG